MPPASLVLVPRLVMMLKVIRGKMEFGDFWLTQPLPHLVEHPFDDGGSPPAQLFLQLPRVLSVLVSMLLYLPCQKEGIAILYLGAVSVTLSRTKYFTLS